MHTRPPSTERVSSVPCRCHRLFCSLQQIFFGRLFLLMTLRLFGSASINAHVLHRRSVSFPCLAVAIDNGSPNRQGRCRSTPANGVVLLSCVERVFDHTRSFISACLNDEFFVVVFLACFIKLLLSCSDEGQTRRHFRKNIVFLAVCFNN